MIRESRSAPDFSALARELERNREALEAARWGVLSGVAESLAGAAKSLSETAYRLEAIGGKEYLVAEEAALHMGYVDRETGEPETKKFQAAMRAAGVPRRKLNGTTIYYKRSELEAFLDALPRA